MRCTIAVLVLTATSALGLTQIAQANRHVVKSDPGLLAALRSDRQLRASGCILAAKWLNESYPRIIVNTTGWKKLRHSGRALLGARALHVAEATFLAGFGVPDQYEQIFIVDQSGRLLSGYRV
jgi:hypothetical protein